MLSSLIQLYLYFQSWLRIRNASIQNCIISTPKGLMMLHHQICKTSCRCKVCEFKVIDHPGTNRTIIKYICLWIILPLPSISIMNLWRTGFRPHQNVKEASDFFNRYPCLFDTDSQSTTIIFNPSRENLILALQTTCEIEEGINSSFRT